jgi:hypothetical protein
VARPSQLAQGVELLPTPRPASAASHSNAPHLRPPLVLYHRLPGSRVATGGLGAIADRTSSALATAIPADVLSRIIARSNSANEPIICIIIRTAGVAVSRFSVIDRKPASASPIRSIICSTSLRKRDSRSSFQTTTVSPSRSWSSIAVQFRPVPAATRGRFLEQPFTARRPEGFSLQALFCSFPFGDPRVGDQRTVWIALLYFTNDRL